MSWRYLLVGLALGGLALAGCGGGDADGGRTERTATPGGSGAPQQDERIENGVIISPKPDSAINTFSTAGWRTDFTRHTVPYDELMSGGPPKDGIPSIDKPKFDSFAEADGYLADKEPVMALEVKGDARAYPLQILIWHEIVNDTVGGEPVVVTYCPLCNTALAFRRTFEGEVFDFGTTGNLRHSDLVMYDRQTETWWQQITGEGIVGRHAGKALTFVAASILSYQEFKEAYPQGKVLSRDTGFSRAYGDNPYVGYDGESSRPFLFEGRTDDRLPATARVVSFVLNDEPVAYPFRVLEQARVVNDAVGGLPVVIFFEPGTKSALDSGTIRLSKEVGTGVAFHRTVDGKALTFERDGEGFVDKETRSRWNIAGKASSGPLAGAQLEPIVHGNHFWFAWAVFRPDTRVYGG